jgi:pimeloyl-ACP methyl ester carboxylesterase
MSRLRPRVVLKGLALLVAAALVCGILYEQFGRRQDRRRLLQIGRSVDIGGRTLNIFCSGSGGPAVIFESASGIGLEWQPVQTEVAKFTKACWYDRAGMGWSDTGPFPRTSAAIARDLHELLKKAGVPPPYVLAGFSFGGLPLREYGGLYPNEVAGMVLVDSAQEEEPLRAPRFYLAHTAPRFLWRPLDLAFRAAALVGSIRLTQSSPAQSQTLSQMTHEEIIAALRQQPKSVASSTSTGLVEPESYAQAGSVRDLGNLPLIVLTAGQPIGFRDPELNRQAAAYQQVWIHEMQSKLVRLSTRGRQIVLPSCNHGSIPPEAVTTAIREVVTDVRSQAASR